MGYNTRVSGSIAIRPPISAAELRAHPEFTSEDASAHIETAQEIMLTDDGELTRISGVAIVPWGEDRFKAYDLVETVQAIVSAFPDRTYTGRFDCAGEDDGDLWRLKVQDGRAVEIRPRIVWPGGEGMRPQ